MTTQSTAQNPSKSTAPPVSNILTVLAAANGIDRSESAAGVTVIAYLPKGTAVDDTMELLINGSGFAKPVKRVITAADLSVRKITLTIFGDDSVWGADGDKVLSARIIDSNGNAGIAGGNRTVKLVTNTPSVQAGSLRVEATTDNISTGEKTAGVTVDVNLADRHQSRRRKHH